MDSLWICEVKDNVTQVHFFCLIPWNNNGSLKEDWDLIQAIGWISTVMISFVQISAWLYFFLKWYLLYFVKKS